MYESEVNEAVESFGALPLEIRKRFTESGDQIEQRTLLPWGEHCTECVWPTCYTTCDLYSPRKDGACRLFADGMVRLDYEGGASPYLLKLRFKRWAKLWTLGNLVLHPLAEAGRKERFNIIVGAAAQALPLPASLQARALGKINYTRRRFADNGRASGALPDCFFLECYNPSDHTVTLTLTLRLRAEKNRKAFHKMIPVPSGYARTMIALSEIIQQIDLQQPFEVEIIPNECDDTILYFGLIDFVKERRVRGSGSAKENGSSTCKCIVWDLDNTLWDGTLNEDGPEGIRLRQEVVEVIKETDQRGILHSIASKNNHDEATKILRLCGIEEYFLYPQINWQPKSHSLARIAQLLNIGVDTLIFVDDQQFEREEVKAALPQVVTVEAVNYATIPDRPECRVPVTEESRARRSMYREQQARTAVLESYNGDYLQFLRDCQIQASISPLDDRNLERVYELAQRTNRLNFSGNRYPKTQLTEIMESDFLEAFVVKCKDRFGSYGITGFAVVDTREPRLMDLMFSCRIQGKRLEHAVLSFLLTRFALPRNADFYASYRKTSKNAAAGAVFEEIGFECVDEKEGIASLVFRYGREIRDEAIVKIIEEGEG